MRRQESALACLQLGDARTHLATARQVKLNADQRGAVSLIVFFEPVGVDPTRDIVAGIIEDVGQESFVCHGSRCLTIAGPWSAGATPATALAPSSTARIPPSPGCRRPRRSTLGQRCITARTTRIVPTPPPTTDATAPNQSAVMPDSKPPSSFDELTKTALTAETRPRIASGVSICTRVPRTTTLILSSAPATASATNDRRKLRDSPKTTIIAPKPATASSSARPARASGGRWAIVIAIASAPRAGAARSQPRPTGPTSRTSFAKIGNSAVAPPSSTANRSSVIVARISSVRKTKRTPASREASDGASDARSAGRGRIVATSPAQVRAQAAASRYASPARPARAISSPPSAGPVTAAICQPLLFQVTALASSDSGTTSGTRDHRAGALSARAQPATRRHT